MNATAELGKLKLRQEVLVGKAVGLQEDILRLERLVANGAFFTEKPKTIADLVKALILAEGKPIALKQIVRKVKAAGMVKGKQADTVVYISMRRSKKFRRVARGFYDVR